LAQLSIEERQLIFTETCPEFTKLLAEIMTHCSHSGNNRYLVSASSIHEGTFIGKIDVYQGHFPDPNNG